MARSTSASSATSQGTASARPPRRSIVRAVSRAARSFTSATMTLAPSLANRSAPSRPWPIPAPVMNATLPLSRTQSSDALEVPLAFPVRDHGVERFELEPRRVEIVVVDRFAERAPRDRAALELGDRLAQRAGHLRQRGVLVGIAPIERWRVELLLDAV